MAIVTTERLGNYLDAFAGFGAAAGKQPAWLRDLREQGFARFCETGFPTTKDEDWRFTNVSAIAQTPFELASHVRTPKAEALEPFHIPGAACQLVFVNGRFAPGLSSTGKLPAGVKVRSLAQALSEDGAEIERHLGRYLNMQRDAFCALNTAFMEDGAYVFLPRRAALPAPICLLFVSISGDKPQMAHPRNLIVAEDETEANVVEDYISFGSGVFFSNVATELVAGENAIISHHLVEREDRQAFNVSTLRMQ